MFLFTAGRELELERHQEALSCAEKYNQSKISLETFMQCLIALAGRDIVVRSCDLSPSPQVLSLTAHAPAMSYILQCAEASLPMP